jgi:anti-anti-sigma factor
MAVLSKPELSADDGVTIVTFGPDYRNITEDVIPSVLETLLAVAGGDTRRVVVDLSNTEFFGSSFIEVLFRLWRRLSEHGGKFALCLSAPYCVEVLKVTHLDSLWPICPTLDQAVAAVRREN